MKPPVVSSSLPPLSLYAHEYKSPDIRSGFKIIECRKNMIKSSGLLLLSLKNHTMVFVLVSVFVYGGAGINFGFVVTN